MPAWKLITNHGAVLALISKTQHITARDLATLIGITERSVLRILGDLESDGYIERTREGRTNKYSISRRLQLRHDFARDVAVSDFLALFEE